MERSELKRILTEARDLIRNPVCWSQNYFGETAEGEMVDGTDPRACRFCSAGAIQRVVQTEDWSLESEAEDYLVRFLPEDWLGRDNGNGRYTRNIRVFNDTQSHEAVMAVWDRAIASLE